MAFEQIVLDLPAKNTSGTTLNQFSVVMYDTTNANGVVQPGNANAGPVMGVQQSKSIDATTGALLTVANNGDSVQVRVLGISRVVVSAATVVGAPLYATSGVGTGTVSNVGGLLYAGSGFVGYGLEAGTGSGDVVACFVAGPQQPALKKVVTTTIGNTQASIAHGLGYVPNVVLIKPKGNAVFWESQAADATNVYITGSVAGPTNADIFVA